MRIVAIIGALLAAVTLSLEAASGGRAGSDQQGGTFRVGIPDSVVVDSIDPILANFPGALTIHRASCAGLMRYPDAPFPAGLRLVPEIAAGYPKVTADRRSYTFTIRKGFRFSTGQAVTAQSFAHTINRLLSPTMKSPFWGDFADIVGVRAIREERAATASGVVARGNNLTIRLTKAVGDFPARISSLCVVPDNTRIDPEGTKAPVHAAGPYYVSEYEPGKRLVLARNRFYAGVRPHRVDRIVVEIGGDPATILARVDGGQLDYGFVNPESYMERGEEFRDRYGINKKRFFTAPALNLRTFVLNTSRPLFRKNPMLRQAVNFAADRVALLRERGGPLAGYLTDQYLPPFAPGFRNERIYPLKAPDVAKARELAKGRTRSGKAVLYVSSSAQGSLAQGQVLAANLKTIGIDVEIQAFPSPVLFARLKTPGEPFDIGWAGYIDLLPPGDTVLGEMFDGRTIANAPEFGNYSYFDSPKYNRLLEQASRLPYGPERETAYAALDVDIARNAAPAIAIAYDRVLTLVSARTGCVVVDPFLNLAAVCLK